jgi:hypothetical protein
MNLRAISTLLLLALALPAQQLRWQVPSPPSNDSYLRLMPFGDFDGDGYRDVAAIIMPNPPSPTLPWIQIRSGVDGSVLHLQLEPRMANVAHAGDVDGDGVPDAAVLWDWGNGVNEIFLRSLGTGQTLWSVTGSWSLEFGEDILGDLDVNGDGRPDLVTATGTTAGSDVFVYDSSGALLYSLPFFVHGRIVISLAKMGDMDGDGCDDFLVGCNDISNRGALVLVSGRTGSTIQVSYGLLPGDRTSEYVQNLGDIDGDGITDYVGFPYWSAFRAIVVAFSGRTGLPIRSWNEYGNSAVAGEDFDQDGVPDLVIGADWPINPPNIWGSTRCYSGRDGTELWRVDNFAPPQGTGSNGTTGWMEHSASLGVQPGSPYPVVAWMDIHWFVVGTAKGRIRAYDPARAGQGPVTGTACTSTGSLPLIGTRKLGTSIAGTGSRITVAKTHPNALAVLNLAFTALPGPVDLTPLGFQGCTVYVDPVASYLRVTGTTGIDHGYAAVDLPYPPTTAISGTTAVGQWLVFEPATLAHAATQMHGIRLQ